MKRLYPLLIILCSNHLFSALPPFYESLKEYQALLADPQLTQALDSADWIESIQHQEGGFLIQTSKHTLQVDVVYDPQKMVGPAHFHFVFHAPQKR